VFEFYRTIEPYIKKSTVNWRIYNLVQLGIIKRIGRGKFVLGDQTTYVPDIPTKLKSLNNKLKKRVPFLNTCLWTTAVYNEFMLHQPGKFFLIVEVDKDAVESVFNLLKDLKYSVFLDPTKELLNKYMPEGKETWIVKSLVTEAPIQKVSDLHTTTIEKMLVDLFCDTVILDAQQGAEKDRIFKGAFEKYIIHENKMLRYADRRRKKKQLIQYLNKLSKFRQQNKKDANL
jgi:hypothetical protein